MIEVAEAAGVSPQTVSNVLAGRGGFTDRTRDRVLAVADELGYQPNRAAQQLRSQRSNQLGLHVPARWLTVREPFTISFLCAATEAAERHGQQLVVFTTPLDKASVMKVVRSGVDGFVLCNVNEEDPRPRMFTELAVPYALMGRIDPSLPQNSVDIDNAAAMALAVDHLIQRGRRRFVYVGHPGAFYSEADRLVGTRRRLSHHGVQLSEQCTITATIDDVAMLLAPVLDACEPDAVICSTDNLAIRVLDVLRRRGVTPGLEIAVTGFDGLPMAIDVDPPLTTVRLPIEQAADEVTRRVLAQIAGENVARAGSIIPAELLIGGTS